MATQNHTLRNHSCALNVVDPITVKNAKKVKKHQQNAHYAEAINIQITVAEMQLLFVCCVKTVRFNKSV
jgi:hypothetical protein